MNVYLKASLIGDTVCAINCIEALALLDSYKGLSLNLKVENPALKIFFKHIQGINFTDEIMSDMIVLSPHDFFNEGQSLGLHMTQGYFLQAKLNVPTLTKPNIIWEKTNKNIPVYDYIIAPYSWSDLSDEKLWAYSNWQDVINYLKSKDKDVKIAVLGASGFALEKNQNKQIFYNVDYIFDKPLEYVCELIFKTKLALTIDNGISHLVHGIGTPHILLYPECLNQNWVKNFNDNARVIRAQPSLITVQNVIDKIEEAAN